MPTKDWTSLDNIEKKIAQKSVQKELSATLSSSLKAWVDDLKKYLIKLFSASTTGVKNFITSSLAKFETKRINLRKPDK